MDNQSLRCLTNSISHFIHLVSSQTVRAMPMQKDYRNMVDSLKLLKPVIDEVIDSKIILDEILRKEIEELDVAVNEARDFLEKWSPRMSRICGVLQSGPLAMKVQCCSLKICHVLCKLLESSTFSSQLASVQRCMQELRFLEQERISDVIEVALRDQKDSLKPCASHLTKVVESIGLTSNQDLLMESVALEKERSKSILDQNREELDLIDQIMYLIGHIRDCMAKHEQFEIINDLLVPPYFRCPLSLGLMLDPVIVASGQTYERAFIQKWLDHGLTVCPKTRQTLVHSNLIPNYTVKALIANWCEENNIRFFDNANNGNGGTSNFLSRHVSPQDLFRPDTFQGGVHDSNCTSRSSVKALVGSQKEGFEVSAKYDEEYSNVVQTKMTSKYNRPSPGQSYIHSRSESTSSAISSIEFLPTSFAAAPTEMSGLSSKRREVNELSGEVSSEFHVSSSSKESGFSPCLSSKQYCSPKARESVVENAGGNHQKKLSFTYSESGLDDLTTASHVEALIEDLKSQSNEAQAAAAAELRLLAKHNMENRLIIAECGAIPLLVSLLYSVAKLTQEHAVTALLNLSINDRNKVKIAEAGAIEPLIHVLESGNAGAKENAAATMFSISVLEEYKIKIGRSGAIKALVDLLGSGTLRGKKDAATALFNLSIFHENKARIVQAGAVKYLIELMDPDTGMIDKAVALLANLSTIPEGRLAITREGGIPLLVEVVETGSQRGKENAASILLQLCINSQKFCSLVLQEGAVPPLVALSQSGTPRAKEKAQQLLSHFRNQREGATGKVKS